MLTDEKIPYEILVRFGADGAPQGAHVQYRRIVTLDGERLKDDVLPAEPLDLEDFPTSEIMTNATRDAIAAAARLTSENAALSNLVATCQSTLEALQVEVQRLTSLYGGGSV